jgi:hypothetical protein
VARLLSTKTNEAVATAARWAASGAGAAAVVVVAATVVAVTVVVTGAVARGVGTGAVAVLAVLVVAAAGRCGAEIATRCNAAREGRANANSTPATRRRTQAAASRLTSREEEGTGRQRY